METTTNEMTAREFIASIRPDNPGRRFAVNPKEDAIAVWHQERWVPVLGQLIGGLGWAPIQSELLVNGEPVWFGWVEVL